MGDYRVLFLGQKSFGEGAWERLTRCRDAGLKIAAACTNVSADKVWWGSNRIYRERGEIPVIDNSARNNHLLQDAIERYNVNLILSVQHPWILPPEVLSLVHYNAINFHNAKLPLYKGYNAVNHAILNDDREFACTAHWMAEEVDKGEIILECVFKVAPQETAISLYAKSHHAGLALFEAVIERLLSSKPLGSRPCQGQGRFYPRDSIVLLREITDLSSSEIDRKARAFFFPPFEPAYLIRNGQKLYVLPQSAFEHYKLVMNGNSGRNMEAMFALGGDLQYRLCEE